MQALAFCKEQPISASPLYHVQAVQVVHLILVNTLRRLLRVLNA